MVYGSAVSSAQPVLANPSAGRDGGGSRGDEDVYPDRPIDAGRRRLIVAAIGVMVGGGLVARSITSKQRAAPAPSTLPASTTPSPTPTTVSPPGSTRLAGSQSVELIPTGGLFVWHGTRVEARALGKPLVLELGQIEPVGPPTMEVVLVGGDDRSSAVVVFGRDASGADGGIGLWLLQGAVAPRLITRGARWSGGASAAEGRFWVQGNDDFVRQYGLDSGRGGLPAEIAGELVGSTSQGVVADEGGVLSWVARREWTMVGKVIGRGRHLDSGADTVLWRTANGKLRVTSVSPDGEVPSDAVIDSDSARMGRLSPFGPFAAVIDQDELIVWNIVSGEQKRFAQQRLVHIVWLSMQQLLLVNDDGAAEVFDLAASMSGAAVGSGAPKAAGSSVTVKALPPDVWALAWRPIAFFADYEPSVAPNV
jgi:hypothetical protein